MSKRPKSEYRIPSFKGLRSFKPLAPERAEEQSGEASDPMLRPEEQGRIKRYLRYADTLINGPETDGPETSGSKITSPGASPEKVSDNPPTNKGKAA
jgi:hypothetical protein